MDAAEYSELTSTDLIAKTLPALRYIAKNIGMRGYSKQRKGELVDSIVVALRGRRASTVVVDTAGAPVLVCTDTDTASPKELARMRVVELRAILKGLGAPYSGKNKKQLVDAIVAARAAGVAAAPVVCSSTESSSALSRMRVVELRAILKGLGAPYSGKNKKQLVDAIVAARAAGVAAAPVDAIDQTISAKTGDADELAEQRAELESEVEVIEDRIEESVGVPGAAEYVDVLIEERDERLENIEEITENIDELRENIEELREVRDDSAERAVVETVPASERGMYISDLLKELQIDRKGDEYMKTIDKKIMACLSIY